MSNRNRKDTTIMPFHTLISTAETAGAASVLGNPAGLGNSGRLLTEADGWAHFRLRKLSFRLHPQTGMAAQFTVAGWVGGIQDTPPATAGAVTDLIPSCVEAQDATVPTEWVKVPKSDLSGPLPWYKTVAGTADATEEAPGQISIAGSGTDVFVLEIRGVIEFKVSVATANTPAEIALRAKLRQDRLANAKEAAQRRVLATLGCQPVLPTQPTIVLPSGRVMVRE